MDFRVKSYLQKLFSVIPMGEKVNFLFQRHVTRTVPASDTDFKLKVSQVKSHIENYERFNSTGGEGKTYFEFGAGWELLMPLAFASEGFEVHCIDLRKLSSVELVNGAVKTFDRLKNEMQIGLRSNRRVKSLEDLSQYYNVHYKAPSDARETGYGRESMNFISTTSTLEHIPAKDIELILMECKRILKKGGVASMLIDYKDHYSYFDKSISHYNFLAYDEDSWKRFNPSLHYQNRLRHSEYLSIIKRVGLEVVKEVKYLPKEKDLAILESLPLSHRYRNWERTDLGILGSELVLKKV